MKVIFLDIDGVLNVMRGEFDEFGQLFHQQYEENLRVLIELTGAKIVISSSWRFSGLKWLQDMWKKRKLAGEVIDITPDCAQIVDSGVVEFYDKVERGHEIQEWLNNHPEVTSYVIVDDDSDMLESQKSRFVRTANNTHHTDAVDIGYGLTKECTIQAIKILNGI